MKVRFDHETELIFSCLVNQKEESQQVYLVGGIVRDILLHKPIHDIDISYTGNVKQFAKNVADTLGAKFFMLNEEFQTARIIYQTKDNIKRWIDVVATREKNIKQDLYLRDFTVNSIAINLLDRNKIIDPFGGALDLQRKILTVTNPNSMVDDPVRILRGIRLAVQFGWRISSETIQLIKNAAGLLNLVTNERKRDELFKILDLPNPAIAIKILIQLNLLKFCLPGLIEEDEFQRLNNFKGKIFDNTIRNIEKFVEYEELIIKRKKFDAAVDIFQANTLINLGGFREDLSNYLQTRIHEDRNFRSLSILGFLYFDLLTQNIETCSNKNNLTDELTNLFNNKRATIKDLVLTKNEEKWLYLFLENSLLIDQFVTRRTEITPVFAYEFFNKTKNSGIGICLFSFARNLRNNKYSHANLEWESYLETVRFLVDAYFRHFDEWINPTTFLNGHDVMNICRVKDGKVIGKILDEIKIKIIVKELNNRQQVVDYLKKKY